MIAAFWPKRDQTGAGRGIISQKAGRSRTILGQPSEKHSRLRARQAAVGSSGPGAEHPVVPEVRQLADTIYRTVLNSGARLPPAHRATLLGAFSAK